MKAILIRIAIGVLPEIVDMIIHALQSLSRESNNDINDMDAAKIIKNKDKIVAKVKQK